MDGVEHFEGIIRDEFDIDEIRFIAKYGCEDSGVLIYYDDSDEFYRDYFEEVNRCFESIIYDYLDLDFKEVINGLLSSNDQFHNLHQHICQYCVEFVCQSIVWNLEDLEVE